MNEENEYIGIVEKTFWNHNYGEYHIDVKVKNKMYKLNFRHPRTYVVDDGDTIKFKGLLENGTNEIKALAELWVKLV